MTLVWRPGNNAITDPDALIYIDKVEKADGQNLEYDVAKAINDFVVGCKTDGIWSAIKASCILAGPRTLAGALVPLVGTAPTNNNFISGDYNRKTGIGDSSNSSKYLNSNRAENADPDNLYHAAVFVTAVDPRFPASVDSTHLGVLDSNSRGTAISIQSDSNVYGWSRSDFLVTVGGGIRPTQNSLFGIARNGASNATIRVAGNNYVRNPQIPGIFTTGKSLPYYIFAANYNSITQNHCRARLSFYSIGESLDLAKLDTRVSALITAIGVAIP